MSTPLLATKLYIPPPPPKLVPRPRLIERLNEGLHRKLTLVSAAAGFGKTTLVSSWVAACGRPVAWLSLDKGDNDPARFLTYLVGALRTIEAGVGEGALRLLQSPQPPHAEAALTPLLNDISGVADKFLLVLDDYHVIDAEPVEQAIIFLIENLPPQMHLVIATREDPQLPLARLRARDQLTELRVADLRFTPSEAAGFLNEVMGLDLSVEDIDALESRTEGWIAGLQLAAISLHGNQAPAGFIKTFTGTHHFVLDYLIEEVLTRQPERVQEFLLRTSILDRLCGPLCDAVLLDDSASGQETLEYIEHANLFIMPLDNERRWYRYHHLFADLLRQRLRQRDANSETRVASTESGESDDASPENEPLATRVSRFSTPSVAELHRRASQWYEDNGLDIEAFYHAVAANDVERAERLIEGKGTPLHLRGLVTAMVEWLGSLPKSVLDARPSLWFKYGSLLLVIGQTTGVEEKLDAAEAALQGSELDEKARHMLGQIAAARATLALTRYQADVMRDQSLRALEYLHPNNRSMRANAHWTLGYAYLLKGDRAAARQALVESISLSRSAGDVFTTILATIGLGMVQELDCELHEAADTYRQVLQMAGDQPLQIIYEAHLGLARVLYEWNDLQAAEQHGRQSLHLARQYDRVIDRFIVCEVFLARVQLAQGDVEGASDLLAQAARSARLQNFVYRIPEVAAVQVQALLRQGDTEAAAQLAQAHNLPLSRARVLLAKGDIAAGLALLEPLRAQMEEMSLKDEQLKVLVLQADALHAHGETGKALHTLNDALSLAEPGGFVRIFVDEGTPILQLLSAAASNGMKSRYISTLLDAFPAEQLTGKASPALPHESLVEPLSQRELEVLHLIAQGLSNHEISRRLVLAVSTVKGHNQRIFDKLQVESRTEAIARARELGLL